VNAVAERIAENTRMWNDDRERERLEKRKGERERERERERR